MTIELSIEISDYLKQIDAKNTISQDPDGGEYDRNNSYVKYSCILPFSFITLTILNK